VAFAVSNIVWVVLWSWDSASIVTIVARLYTGWLRNHSSIPSKGKRS